MPLYRCGGGSMKQLTLTPAGQSSYNIKNLLPDKYDKLNNNNFSLRSAHMYFKGGDYGAGYGGGTDVNLFSYNSSTGILTVNSSASYSSWAEGAGVVGNYMTMNSWTVVVNYV